MMKSVYFVYMKLLTKLFWLTPVLFIFLFQGGLTSCTKDPEVDTDTITIIKHDTLIVCPSATPPEQILTTGTWIINEIRFLESNTLYYYKRGATGNTANFDTESIHFNSNKTGTYIAGGITYNVAWDFVNNDKSRIQYTVSYSPVLTVRWENISYTDSTIKYTEYYTRNGSTNMGYATRKKQ
jgi:hypothetical protein